MTLINEEPAAYGRAGSWPSDRANVRECPLLIIVEELEYLPERALMSGGLGYLGAEQFEWTARQGCRQPLDPIHGQTPFSRF